MYFLVSLVLIVFMLIVPERADARKWRVKPSDLAADYSQIIDQRPGNDLVVIYWVAPETMDANIKNVDAYRAMLRDYMLVGVAHGNANQSGRITFRVPESVMLQLDEGKPRQSLAEGSVAADGHRLFGGDTEFSEPVPGPARRGISLVCVRGKGDQ